MPERRPRVGITTRVETLTNRFYVARFYSEAVEAAGGVPLMIPLIPKAEYIAALAEDLDAVLLPGSDSDVDPLLYGREPHPQLGTVQPLKDATDLLLLAEAERRGLPLLAICFGMQVWNVARGGTLVQDIGALVPQAIKHEQGSPGDRRSHRVRFLEESRLAALAQSEAEVVNSHHHQAVETIGRDLLATAWTSDGVVEALEDTRRDRFALGVQWHPEINWEGDDLSRAIFGQFIAAGQRYRESLETVETGNSQFVQ
ncbi:MAG: gamma-glutamyl-gamma-aminobutyrate hydrolase family protein [Pyrinomonadaceae bacterium]